MGLKCPDCLLWLLPCLRSKCRHYRLQRRCTITAETSTQINRPDTPDSSSTEDLRTGTPVPTEVHDSPMALPFLLLLQNLSQLDATSEESNQVWELLERVSSKAANGGLAHLQRGLNFRLLVLDTKDEATQTPKGMRRFGKKETVATATNNNSSSNNTTTPAPRLVTIGTQTDNVTPPPASLLTLCRKLSPPTAGTLSSDSGDEIFFDTRDSPSLQDPTNNNNNPFHLKGFPTTSNLSRSLTPLELEGFRPRPFPHSSLPPPPPHSPPAPPSPGLSTPASSRTDDSGIEDGDRVLPTPSPTLAPPPPPPPPPMGPPPPPPPPSGPPPPPPLFQSSPSPSPGNFFQRPHNIFGLTPFASSHQATLCRSSPYATLPRPKHKMKTLNWTKLPNQVLGDESVWKAVHDEISPNIQIDYDKMEELFCQKQSSAKNANSATPKLQKAPSEVTLLDGKRSLNINIFLKQFKCSLPELIELIRNGKSQEIGAEKLRAFQKVLPEKDEVELVKSYRGDATKLGVAERFIWQLSTLISYALRLDAMLQREEFPQSVEALKPQLTAVSTTANELLTNQALKEFLALVLHTGNFLNAGSYAGNAVGFKLNTLPKLYETRANKPRVTLLHFLVEVAERENASMLNFTTNMKSLAQVSRLSLDGMESEVRQLGTSIAKLERQLVNAPSEVKTQFRDFVKSAQQTLKDLERQVNEIQELKSKLARHFCEDETKFKIEDCFITFAGFCEKVKQARVENEQRKKQEERAAKLKEQHEKTSGIAKKPVKRESSQFMNEEVCLVEKLLNEIKKGSFKLRKTQEVS